MSTYEVPEPWASAMIKAGVVDPRRKEDVPSITQLAHRAGLAVETVRRMIRKEGIPDPGNVAKVAEALNINRVHVSHWLDQDRVVEEDWHPPADAALLDKDQREVLDHLIRVMAAPKRKIRESVLEMMRPEALLAQAAAEDRVLDAVERLTGVRPVLGEPAPDLAIAADKRPPQRKRSARARKVEPPP